jgi:hypothetical protein
MYQKPFSHDVSESLIPSICAFKCSLIVQSSTVPPYLVSYSCTVAPRCHSGLFEVEFCIHCNWIGCWQPGHVERLPVSRVRRVVHPSYPNAEPAAALWRDEVLHNVNAGSKVVRRWRRRRRVLGAVEIFTWNGRPNQAKLLLSKNCCRCVSVRLTTS